MKKIVLSMFVIGLIGLPAYAQKDENDRIKNSGFAWPFGSWDNPKHLFSCHP
jgi:hypothetical protein